MEVIGSRVGALGGLREAYIEDADFIDSFTLRVRLGRQVLVNVLKVGDRDVFLELLVQDDVVVDKFDLAREVLQGSSTLHLGGSLLVGLFCHLYECVF